MHCEFKMAALLLNKLILDFGCRSSQVFARTGNDMQTFPTVFKTPTDVLEHSLVQKHEECISLTFFPYKIRMFVLIFCQNRPISIRKNPSRKN